MGRIKTNRTGSAVPVPYILPDELSEAMTNTGPNL